MLNITDFDTKKITKDLYYFEHRDAVGRSVCIEPCLSGYDVGLYYHGDLMVAKRCTNIHVIDELTNNDALVKALRIANHLWSKRDQLHKEAAS